MNKRIACSVFFLLAGIMMAPAQTSTVGASKETPFVNSLGMKFAPVPWTKVLFCIWDTRVQDYRAYAEATPGVDGGWKTLSKMGEDCPVVLVSWEDAKAFCAWLTQKERKEGKIAQNQEYRLPTDKEWTAAVGDSKYPWGNQWPPAKGAGNYADESFGKKNPTLPWIKGYDDGYSGISPVGSFKANQFGLYDMGGNVWQWCEDWYRAEMNGALLDKYPGFKDDGGGQKYRVDRGASYSDGDPVDLLSSTRNDDAPNIRVANCGFRCVLAPVAP